MSPSPNSRLPALGRRGEGWVLGQFLLLAAVLLSALAGRSWSGGYAVAAITIGAVLIALGVLMLAWSARHLGASLTPFPAPRARLGAKTTGPYALARHPMYGAVILLALGWTIIFATVTGLVLTVALTVLLDLKSRREEAWLRERVDGYEDYYRRTPRRLLPFAY